MATPLTADRLVDALRAEGVTVVEHTGWRTHNRAGHGAWGPVNGVIIHHTVTSGTQTSVDICWNGYTALPGPLCHGVIAKDGTVYLVGNGRANHAGSGDGDVLAAVIDERQERPSPTKNDTDGNVHFYGFECVNLGDGKDPWPDVQLEAMVRASAALCRAHGWSARSVIGHKEWTNTKIDPRGFTMADFRARVAARLGAKPSAGQPSSPSTPKVSLAHVIAAARRDPAAAQGHTTYKAEVLLVERALRAEGLLAAAYVDGSFGTLTVAAYARWQRSPAGGGYVGSAADGIPGSASLKRLGAKHNFTVTA